METRKISIRNLMRLENGLEAMRIAGFKGVRLGRVISENIESVSIKVKVIKDPISPKTDYRKYERQLKKIETKPITANEKLDEMVALEKIYEKVVTDREELIDDFNDHLDDLVDVNVFPVKQSLLDEHAADITIAQYNGIFTIIHNDTEEAPKKKKSKGKGRGE